MSRTREHDSRGANVLVVDDDPFIVEMAEFLLGRDGHRVSVASSGAAALAKMAAKPPELVLLDLGLPDISGLEILRYFRAASAWQTLPILVFTASHETENIVRAKRSGASGYVCKPIKPDTLLEMVRDLLDHPDLTWVDDYTRAYRPI